MPKSLVEFWHSYGLSCSQGSVVSHGCGRHAYRGLALAFYVERETP